MSSKQRCEICGRSGGVSGIDFGTRLIALCKVDAQLAKQAGARSPESLRQLFIEVDGRRALLPRRALDERRRFPPRPEGRRHDDGRRGSDSSS
jgi:hypothetical protein